MRNTKRTQDPATILKTTMLGLPSYRPIDKRVLQNAQHYLENELAKAASYVKSLRDYFKLIAKATKSVPQQHLTPEQVKIRQKELERFADEMNSVLQGINTYQMELNKGKMFLAEASKNHADGLLNEFANDIYTMTKEAVEMMRQVKPVEGIHEILSLQVTVPQTPVEPFLDKEELYATFKSLDDEIGKYLNATEKNKLANTEEAPRKRSPKL